MRCVASRLEAPALGPVAAMKLSLGASVLGDGGGVQLVARPPLSLDNALPMPLRVTLISSDSLLTRSLFPPRCTATCASVQS